MKKPRNKLSRKEKIFIVSFKILSVVLLYFVLSGISSVMNKRNMDRVASYDLQLAPPKEIELSIKYNGGNDDGSDERTVTQRAMVYEYIDEIDGVKFVAKKYEIITD